jgi:hypothetical protein
MTCLTADGWVTTDSRACLAFREKWMATLQDMSTTTFARSRLLLYVDLGARSDAFHPHCVADQLTFVALISRIPLCNR